MSSIEKERKFKVRSGAWRVEAVSGIRIWQGWLHADDRISVRIRIAGEEATATCKIKIPGEVGSRIELEGRIDMPLALRLREECAKSLEKTRWIVRRRECTWEVDEYHGELSGIVVAEIENPVESLDYPLWLGDEVTGDPEWENANMARETKKHPR